MEMVLVKTSELSGVALDWAVAKCQGVAVQYIDDGITRCLLLRSGGRYNPSVNWGQAGPIVEREKIGVAPAGAGCNWAAGTSMYRLTEQFDTGPSPLIAAMRCYVASKLGDSVEVPSKVF